MNSIAEPTEAEIRNWKLQLEEVKVGLNDKPGDTGLQSLKADLEELISLSETVAAASAAATAGEVQPAKPATPPTAPVKEKWSKEKHPAYQAGYRKPSWAAQQSDEATLASNSNTSYKVNDVVLARWISGDKAFYPARITSVTGSTSAPVYNVTFKSYNNTETVRSSDLKPHPSESKKRRLEESSGTSQNNNNNNVSNNQSSSSSFYPISTTPNPLDPSSTAANNNATATPGNVISAAASINPTLASQVRKEPSKVSDGPPRPPKAPRKVKANRELEAGKSKWQDFNAKGKMAKYSKKESMFRTPTGVNARVGFTGSGQEMRKDPTRSKHIYQPTDEENY